MGYYIKLNNYGASVWCGLCDQDNTTTPFTFYHETWVNKTTIVLHCAGFCERYIFGYIITGEIPTQKEAKKIMERVR